MRDAWNFEGPHSLKSVRDGWKQTIWSTVIVLLVGAGTWLFSDGRGGPAPSESSSVVEPREASAMVTPSETPNPCSKQSKAGAGEVEFLDDSCEEASGGESPGALQSRGGCGDAHWAPVPGPARSPLLETMLPGIDP